MSDDDDATGSRVREMTEADTIARPKAGLRHLVRQLRKVLRFLRAVDVEREVNEVIARLEADQRDLEAAQRAGLNALRSDLSAIKDELEKLQRDASREPTPAVTSKSLPVGQFVSARPNDMRQDAPPNFDVNEFYRGTHLFQSWEIFPGCKAAGIKDVNVTLEFLDFPKDLSGCRVLEIAPWNGFFSFECVRRGASEVVALGPDDPENTGFNKTMNLLEINNIRYIQDSVYNVPRLQLGQFDIVLFLGLVYHLRHPLLALDYLHDCCAQYLFIDSAIIDDGSKFIFPDQRDEISESWRAIAHLPVVYFSNVDEIAGERDPFNWYIPTARALRDWVNTAGFVVEHEKNVGGWVFARAKKGVRQFQPLLEGYNAAASSLRR